MSETPRGGQPIAPGPVASVQLEAGAGSADETRNAQKILIYSVKKLLCARNLLFSLHPCFRHGRMVSAPVSRQTTPRVEAPVV